MSLSEPVAAAAAAAAAAAEGEAAQETSVGYEAPPQGRRGGVTINKIFKATYSGVPVYEFICRGIAVMRRRSDAYLNATQILKVANFDKPQRTRILEREIQTGEHEKVQGGYGKYQGTWVPFERGLRLARQYHIEEELRLVFDYVPTAESPPLAPKHITAATNRSRKPRGQDVNGVPKRKHGGKRPARTRQPVMRTAMRMKVGACQGVRGPAGHFAAIPTPSVPSSTMPRFPVQPAFQNVPTTLCGEMEFEVAHSDSDVSSAGSGIGEAAIAFSRMSGSDSEDVSDLSGLRTGAMKRRRLHAGAATSHGGARDGGFVTPSEFAEALRKYFLSGGALVPRVLVHLPPNLDVNLPIDTEGHSALHWAAATGNIRLVQVLMQQGANIGCINCANQTPLIRAVMRPDNYEHRTFSELLEVLRPSMFAQDCDGRTVLHHGVRMAGLTNMGTAARYYMERLVDRILLNFEDLCPLVDISDANGDTALTLAAKLGDRRQVLILLRAGGDPTIKNKMNKSADDYATEYMRREGCASGSGELGHITSNVAQGQLGDSLFSVGAQPNPQLSGDTATPAAAGNVLQILDGLGISGLMTGGFAGNASAVDQGRHPLATRQEIARTNVELRGDVQAITGTHRDAEDARLKIEAMQPEADCIRELWDQVRDLETELRRAIYHNQRLKLRSLVHQLSDQLAREKLQQRRDRAGTRNDLLAEAFSLRDTLSALLRERGNLVEEVAHLRSECGGQRYNLYRCLIAKCCDLAPDEVDGTVQQILEMVTQSGAHNEQEQRLQHRKLRRSMAGGLDDEL